MGHIATDFPPYVQPARTLAHGGSQGFVGRNAMILVHIFHSSGRVLEVHVIVTGAVSLLQMLQDRKFGIISTYPSYIAG